MNKTKILATLGPASSDKQKLKELIRAGATCFRFNLKHNELSWHSQLMGKLRIVAKELKQNVAIYMDLQGPEVRIGAFANQQIRVAKNEIVALSPQPIAKYQTIPLENKEVYSKLKPGHTVYLDDGFIELTAYKKIKNGYLLKVVQGGVIKSNKSANFPNLELDMPTLSAKDREALNLLDKGQVDYVGLSFVRTADDIIKLKKEVNRRSPATAVIAKIETKAAIKNIEAIVDASDGIMIARGDLAVEFAFEKVPFIQKEIINACRMKSKPVIVATQMLQSMTINPLPSRAEASDVANAVYDASDCLMLSEESAAGEFPVKSVTVMAKIAGFIEDKKQAEIFRTETTKMNEVITKAAYEISVSAYAQQENLDKILILTETGNSVRLLSRFRPKAKIIAVSSKQRIVNQLMLSYGVTPFCYSFPKGKLHSTQGLLSFLKTKNAIHPGEKVILIHGESWGHPGRTNTLRIQEIY